MGEGHRGKMEGDGGCSEGNNSAAPKPSHLFSGTASSTSQICSDVTLGSLTSS